jgi:hypothetical protein
MNALQGKAMNALQGKAMNALQGKAMNALQGKAIEHRNRHLECRWNRSVIALTN